MLRPKVVFFCVIIFTSVRSFNALNSGNYFRVEINFGTPAALYVEGQAGNGRKLLNIIWMVLIPETLGSWFTLLDNLTLVAK